MANKKNDKEYVQDIIQEKYVRDGVVITADDPPRYIKILEVFPINFNNRDFLEKETLAYKLEKWFKIAPRSFQLKIITARSNPKEHIVSIQKDFYSQPNLAVREVGESYVKHIQEIARKHALTKRFYFVFSSDGLRDTVFGEEDAINKLNMIASECKGHFMGNGHRVRTFQTTSEENNWLLTLEFETYNRKSCAYDSVEMRKKKQVENYMALQKVSREVALSTITDNYYIAPRGLDFSKPDYITSDGMYQLSFYIEGDSLPNVVGAGWLDWQLPRGIDIDVFYRDKEGELTKAKLRSATNTAEKTSSSFKGESSFKDFFRAKQRAVQQIMMCKDHGERMLSIQIYLTVYARTVKELSDLTRYLENTMESNGIRVSCLKYRQDQAFNATRLVNKPIKAVERYAERLISSLTAAAIYPISAFELADYTGFCLGQNRENESAVFINNFNTSYSPNANILLLGSSGYGKTFSMGVIASRTRLRNIPVFIIAPIKGVEFYRLADLYNGTIIRISPSSPDRINILDIRIPDLEAEVALSGDRVLGTSLLLLKVGSMRPFLKLIYNSISIVEERMMDKIFMEVYADKGITKDNDSLYTDCTKTTLKEMPILGDVTKKVQERLKTNSDFKGLVEIMEWFTEGSGIGFNGQTNVDLKTGFTVIDISDLKTIDEQLVPLGMYIASNIVRGEIEEDRTKNKLLIIDEFWTMCGATSDDSASKFLLEMAKTTRGFGGAIMLASQDLTDLFSKEGGNFGKSILNACKTVMLLGMEAQQASEAQEMIGLTDKETNGIRTSEKGDVLLCMGGSRVPIHIMASEKEDEHITTDAKKLRIIVNNKKKLINTSIK